MDYSYSYLLSEVFNSRAYNVPAFIGNSTAINANSHNFLVGFFKVQDVDEMPSIVCNYRESFEDGNTRELVTPLTVFQEAKKTSSKAIIKWFFTQNTYTRNLGLKKAITGKGTIYYGAHGLILDKNLTPLFIAIKRYDSICNSYADRTLIKIHPKVFESKDLMETFIAKSLIPFYCGLTFVTVEIDSSISNYIVKPSTPKGPITESAKELISKNKEEILKGIV